MSNSWIKIDTELIQNMLTVKTVISGDEGQGIFTYRLKKSGVIVKEVERIADSQCSFVLEDYGQYYVQVLYFGKKKSGCKNSKLIFYSKTYFEEYADFCAKDDRKDIKELSYFEPRYPHQDFCMFQGFDSKNLAINTFMDRYKLCSHEFKFEGETICRLLSTHSIKKENGKEYAFSGIARTEKQLVVGDKDIERFNISVEELFDQVGDFWLISQNGKRVELHHDWLGVSKIYYYQNGTNFIASNRYHLLLLALKTVGVYPKLRIERAIADLSSVSAFARLNYSRKMVMEDTYAMTSDKDMILSKDGVCFKDNDFHKTVYEPKEYNEEEYWSLLKKGADEMLDNMRIALEYEDMDYFKVDLSGGIDSRMVLALITNFPQYHDKIQIGTLDLKAYPKDLPIALELNSMFNYPYNSIPTSKKLLCKRDAYERIISAFLCANQQTMPFEIDVFDDARTMTLPGYMGELIFRPYIYTYLHFSSDEDDLNLKDFIDGREYYHIEGISKGGMEYYRKLLVEELENLPGKLPVERLQNHALFYHLTLHHATYYPYCLTHAHSNEHMNSNAMWLPLVSKTIFYLNYVTSMQFRSSRLAYDLMEVLNPAMAAIPYEKELYNKELRELSMQDSRYGHTFKVAENCIEEQRRKWEDAENMKKINATFEQIKEEERLHIERENEQYQEKLREDVLYALKRIIQYDNGSIGEVVGLDCFSRIYGHNDVPENERWLKFLYGKILTLYYVLRIFDYTE